MKNKKILLTGGAGFIGSNLILYLIKKYPQYTFVNFDKLTYAGNLTNLRSIENLSNYHFVKGDICDKSAVEKALADFEIDTIIHLAAESHVDRSIHDPLVFVKTNVLGTANLLQCARSYWGDDLQDKVFYHISTDEVYGSLGDEGFFTEMTSYSPHSPYSASKASSDHFVRAFYDTYKFPVLISNCSNNYGPYQFPEKLIPLCLNNIINNQPIPVYGKGENVRDWLYVEDHASAIDTILHKGKLGESYNIGGENEWKNIDIVKLIIKIADKKLGRSEGESSHLITFVQDRAGHDLRYAIDATKLREELAWRPSVQFEEGLDKTIDWYLNNQEWLAAIATGEYQSYYE